MTWRPSDEAPQEPWAPLLVLLRGFSPNADIRDVTGIRALLADKFTLTEVLNAAKRLARSGRTFFPQPKGPDLAEEILRMRRPDLEPVSFVQVWSSLQAACKVAPRGTVAEQARWIGDTVAAELGVVAGSFAADAWKDLSRSEDQAGLRRSLSREWEHHQPLIIERALFHGVEPATPAQVTLRRGRPSQIVSAVPLPELER